MNLEYYNATQGAKNPLLYFLVKNINVSKKYKFYNKI